MNRRLPFLAPLAALAAGALAAFLMTRRRTERVADEATTAQEAGTKDSYTDTGHRARRDAGTAERYPATLRGDKLVRQMQESSRIEREAAVRERMRQLFDNISSNARYDGLAEIAGKEWFDSPEFAFDFLQLESSVTHNPRLRERIRQAVILTIPPDRPPPENAYSDRTYVMIMGAIQRVLMNMNDLRDQQEFLRSIATSRPLYADFICNASRAELNLRKDQACW